MLRTSHTRFYPVRDAPADQPMLFQNNVPREDALLYIDADILGVKPISNAVFDAVNRQVWAYYFSPAYKQGLQAVAGKVAQT